MKKPVFADIAELVGGLLADEKKKKKRRTAPHKYDVIDVQKLVSALPARPARVAMPARLPVVLVPGAPRDAPAPALKGRKRTHLEVVRDLSLAKLAAVNVVQTKRRQAAADLLKAEGPFYDPNKGHLTVAKQSRIAAAYNAAKETDTKRARDLGAALDASKAAKVVYETEQARVGIRAEIPEPEEVFADSTPARKGKSPKKSLNKAFADADRTAEEARADERGAKSDARLEALRLKAEARAARETKALAKSVESATKARSKAIKSASMGEIVADAKAKAAREPAKAAKAAPEAPKALVKFQKAIKAQTAARAEVRRKNYELAGMTAPGDLTGTGRFLGRFYR